MHSDDPTHHRDLVAIYALLFRAEIDHIKNLISEFKPKRRMRKDATRRSRRRGRPPYATDEDIELLLKELLPRALASPRYEAWLSERDDLRRGERSALLYIFESAYKQYDRTSAPKARGKAEEIVKPIQNRIAIKRNKLLNDKSLSSMS